VVSPVNVPLSNLRAVAITIVVAFHSALPYVASQPSGTLAFDEAPYRWIAFPITDRERWFGFDLFCAWQDISLMSLMFFMAGLFTPTGLNCKGSLAYLSERCRRIGLPFLFAAGILSPISYYASYRATAADPDVATFWHVWRALPMWPSGPAWFLWQLLALSALAAGLHALAPRAMQRLLVVAGPSDERPLAFFVGLTALSTICYVPLAMRFTPWDWTNLGPFSFQLSRPLHYLLYFFAGFAIGSHGLDRILLRPDGPLARHWPAWFAAAVAGFALWGGANSLSFPDWQTSQFAHRLAAASAFPIACAAGVLGLLAVCLRLMRMRSRLLDSLSANAYGIYLLHYVAVVWLQYALLDVRLNAFGKAAIVCVGGLALSWTASAGIIMTLVSVNARVTNGRVARVRRIEA
jgi:surface polysaccharide O-acyltransferase-like enzyme